MGCGEKTTGLLAGPQKTIAVGIRDLCLWSALSLLWAARGQRDRSRMSFLLKDIAATKQCRKCGAVRSLSEFYKSKTNRDGFFSTCKKCIAAYNRHRYKTNPEKLKEISRRYNEANPEKIKERRRRYRKANKDQIQAWNRQWRAANRERIIEYHRRWCAANLEKRRVYSRRWRKANPEKGRGSSRHWRENNPEKARHYQQNNPDKTHEKNRRYRENHRDRRRESDRRRKAHKLASPGNGFTEIQFAELCARYENCCLCCGCNDMPLTRDHIVPLSEGGADSISNIQPLCLSCNLRKGTKSIDYR